MAEKISDDQVENLLRVLRSDAAVDAKVNHVTAIKSGIKQHNVPDHLVPSIFDALRLASSSQHAVLVNAGFTSLNHLLTRLSRQEPKFLNRELKATLPLVIDKLGDQKEKFRTLAAQALTTLYAVAPADVERMVRNVAMAGKNPRAKEAGMQWVLQMHQEQGLQFRGYVPTLMDLLEDADGMVRDVAKATVIELFRNSPNAAKSDLKRQLKNFKVRPAIEQAIVKELLPSGTRPETPSDMAPPSRPTLAASTSALPSERPITPAPDVRTDKAEPSYVNTQRELEDMLRHMHLHFEGRESEQNWLKREESVKKLRRLIAGNAAQDFREPFLLGLKALLDGIIKAVNSLRTSLSKEGCALVQDIAHAFGPGMDPLVELLMQTFIKLCAATKKIASQQANVTVDAIVGRASYNSRIMQHVWGACQDKNVQPRTYAADWLQTILKKEGHHKSHIEHNGGVELFEKCIKKGLNDSNPGVREKMRGTYWAFASYWPARAEIIMENLDATAQKLLNKDSHNPSAAKKVEEGPVRPGMGLSRSTMATSSKPSLREAMLAQKKAMSGRNLPARPGSAMAHISPARTVSSSSNAPPAAAATSAATTRPRPESTVSGGMSVRPMRPTKKRPEQPQRPATAGPYSVRAHEGPSAEASSPQSLKSRTNTPKAKIETPPRRVPPRTRPGHASHVSESSLPSPTAKITATKTAASPRVSPAKPQPSPRVSPAKPAHAPITLASSPSKANEELTLLVPSVESLSLKDPSPALEPEEQEQPPEVEPASPEPPLPIKSAEPEVPTSPQVAPASPEIVVQSPQKEISTTPSKTLKVFEDPFTEEDQTTPKPVIVIPVLEDRPINENAGVPAIGQLGPTGLPESPDKSRQNTKLLESGITRVKARSLDVHGFRKLQTLIRENRAVFTDEKFDALLTGLFEFLEAPLETLAPEKVQDVKAQILATVKLLLKKERDSFQPHVARGLEALVASRSAYDSRTHIVSGLELLAAELVTIGDAPEMVMTMTKLLGDSADSTTGGCRCLSMGLHILKEVLEKRQGYVPSEGELGQLAGLAGRCLESTESGVRMGAVQLCVALHARIGDGPFWEAVKTTKDDPKNLITYYIAKRQREQNGVST
ncbi:STU1 [Verticillium alfalfae VaMs.102]|uniref:STU1 n=1 Tax=Verticillium alfalfae (strain VaMs.102 / ATCC MYA-4576 / FGSC 10136) TaxID=526221 RepID=C9S7G6_VERA1|nr:STU1 [Verticillium alfalfae VaMs.102]EEY14727.1 STU1 [Verticillium alfalfae VaMs.102]